MSFENRLSRILWEVYEDGCRRCEADLWRFVGPLYDWIDELLQHALATDWRDRLGAYLDSWEPEGFEVEPDQRRILEDWLEALAEFRGISQGSSAQAVYGDVPTNSPATSDDWGASSNLGLAVPVLLAAAPGPGGRLPRSSGAWDGTPGNGTWKPNKPIVLENGIKIDQVPYRDGMPVFDQWSKGEIKIAITGEQGFDRSQAIRAWHANGGGTIPDRYIFHHDGLTTEIVRYKGKDVLVGRMQLVPFDLNRKVHHIGSASTARRFVEQNKKLAKKLADEVNRLAIKGKGPLMKVAKRFSSLLAKGAKKIGRIVPLIGGVLVIIDFTENVEAHGVGGALIRGAPLLGDLITIYDVAGDLAEEIKANADERIQAHIENINRTARQADQAASAITLREFGQLAKRLRVTNRYFSGESLKEPLEKFHQTVRSLIYLRLENRGIAYPPSVTDDERSGDSAFNVKLRIARDTLERDVRDRVEQPGRLEPRGPAT